MCQFFFMYHSDAAYRFFKTKKEAEKNSSKGRDEKLKTTKRRHERIVRVSEGMHNLFLITHNFYTMVTEKEGSGICYSKE